MAIEGDPGEIAGRLTQHLREPGRVDEVDELQFISSAMVTFSGPFRAYEYVDLPLPCWHDEMGVPLAVDPGILGFGPPSGALRRDAFEVFRRRPRCRRGSRRAVGDDLRGSTAPSRPSSSCADDVHGSFDKQGAFFSLESTRSGGVPRHHVCCRGNQADAGSARRASTHSRAVQLQCEMPVSDSVRCLPAEDDSVSNVRLASGATSIRLVSGPASSSTHYERLVSGHEMSRSYPRNGPHDPSSPRGSFGVQSLAGGCAKPIRESMEGRRFALNQLCRRRLPTTW
jgi:hypothetical protein